MPALPLGFHVTLRLADDRVVAPSPVARRRAVRILITTAGPALLAFHVTDTHVHLLLLCGRAEAGELARRIELALGRGLRLEQPFQPARVRPIEDQAHLRAAFDYVLRQDVRHGVHADPYHEGSVVLDLLGLRVLDTGLITRVRERLPRLGRGDLLPRLGVAELAEGEAPASLVPAALAAFALPSLAGRTPEALAARRAVAHVARSLGRAEAAALLDTTERAITRAWAEPAPAAHLRAVRLQVGLRQARAEQPFAEA